MNRSKGQSEMKPTMHPDFRIGQRVRFDLGDGSGGFGTIGGIGLRTFCFSYVVLPDQPLTVPGYDRPWTGILLIGTQLRAFDSADLSDQP